MSLLAAINPSADALGYIQVVPSELYKNEAAQISFVKSQMGNVIRDRRNEPERYQGSFLGLMEVCI
ncbi:hypothetical protein J7M23_02085 [Candidatus Sumerlaeota bacterium]|nr:hypothetical protein [Candidatus Sumerlaeota bacterium]